MVLATLQFLACAVPFVVSPDGQMSQGIALQPGMTIEKSDGELVIKSPEAFKNGDETQHMFELRVPADKCSVSSFTQPIPETKEESKNEQGSVEPTSKEEILKEMLANSPEGESI